ncbi:MAG TPA: cob(I)yrinic acid a,c-diamide adenosyltransferase [Clostridiaceae bacterium]|nr:cob(I)yrinic acid a,c-diamide adenosyltransferase [Clostridiaceae bacterium]
MTSTLNADKIREQLGLVHLYTGDGKGKTTAAAGLAVRARGSGLSVLFVQFLKSGTSAELEPMRELGIEVVSGQPTGKFVFQMDEKEKEEARVFNEARFREAVIRSREEVDLLVFDEILGAIATGILGEGALLDFLKTKPKHLEVVLTGRDPSDELFLASDYVSEVMMRKHPYETSKTPARPGIEY